MQKLLLGLCLVVFLGCATRDSRSAKSVANDAIRILKLAPVSELLEPDSLLTNYEEYAKHIAPRLQSGRIFCYARDNGQVIVIDVAEIHEAYALAVWRKYDAVGKIESGGVVVVPWFEITEIPNVIDRPANAPSVPAN